MEVSAEEIPGKQGTKQQLWDTTGIPRDTQETQLSLEIRASFLEKKVPKPGTGRRRQEWTDRAKEGLWEDSAL